jgi:hypothetical protein
MALGSTSAYYGMGDNLIRKLFSSSLNDDSHYSDDQRGYSR